MWEIQVDWIRNRMWEDFNTNTTIFGERIQKRRVISNFHKLQRFLSVPEELPASKKKSNLRSCLVTWAVSCGPSTETKMDSIQ